MTIAVVGLGAMGLGIAQVYAQAGHKVRATDQVAAARETARARLEAALAPRVAKGSLSAAEAAETVARLEVVEDIARLGPCDLAIEAVAEVLAVKQAVFAALQEVMPNAVLATNTSSLSVGTISVGLTRPNQLLGLHFFIPAPAMRLVELIPHATTSPQALTLARQLTEAAGKVVIQAPDRPGFIVNRCARPYYGEALAMLEERRNAVEIDAAMLAAGYRLGPFALIDLIGADINLAATEGLSAAMNHHPRYHVFAALKAQVASGALGQKAGKGFISGPIEPRENAEISLRIESTLVNEAAWLLPEGGVTAEGIDTAMRLGLNFPLGPFAALQQHGAAKVVAMLNDLEAKAPATLKTRYIAAPMLKESSRPS